MTLSRFGLFACLALVLSPASLALDAITPDTSTSFEFTDMSGAVVVGTSPHDIRFDGGFMDTIGVPSLYNTGLSAWMIPPGGTGTATPRTTASRVDFFVRSQNAATTGIVTVVSTSGTILSTTFPTNTAWTPVSVSVGINDPRILGVFVGNTGGAGLIAVDDFSYCANETGDSMCFGDGGDQMGCTDCPCMNEAPIGSGSGCLNSAGTASGLMALGDPNIMNDTLHFDLLGAPPFAFCILTSGDNIAPTNMANPCFGLNSGIQSSSFDGLRCAVGNTRRHGGRSADMNGFVGVTNNGWGPPNAPMAGFAAQSGFVAGQTRNFQVIHREDAMASCMRGLNTSQAVSITY